MIWSALARGLYWTLGAAQAVLELIGSGRKLVREARKGKVPHVDLKSDETAPIPLTRRARPDTARTEASPDPRTRTR